MNDTQNTDADDSSPTISDGVALYKVGDIAHGVSAYLFEEFAELEKADSDREKSRRLPGYGDDPFRADYKLTADQRVLEPTNNPRLLCYLLELNSTLTQCVDAMATNIEAFGYDLIETVEAVEERMQLEEDIRLEARRIRLFFDYASAEHSWAQLRKKKRKDQETTGNAYWEVVRNVDGSIGGFEHLPVVTMRMTPQDTEYVDSVIRMPSLEENYTYEDRVFPRRFRRFVQIIETTGGKHKIWFKEYGDPRTMDSRTGQFVDEPATGGSAPAEMPMQTARRRNNARDKGKNGNQGTTEVVTQGEFIAASEVIHFRIDDPDSEYGVPRWMGAMLAVLGGRDADETNANFFANGAMWDYAVMISGGHISDETVREIRDLVKKKRGKDHAHKVLVIQVESAASGNVFQQQADKSKVELVPLNHREDMMFAEYQKWCVDRIGEAFRLPPMFFGRMKDYTHANAETSKRVAEEQVFGPERSEFDEFINRFIMPEMGVRYHQFRSRGPTISRAEEMERIMKTFGPYVTGREARLLFAQLTDIRLDDVDENDQVDQIWLWYPAPVAQAMITLMRSMKQVPGSYPTDDYEVAPPPPVTPEADESKPPAKPPENDDPTEPPDLGDGEPQKKGGLSVLKHPALRDVSRFMQIAGHVHEMDRLHRKLADLAKRELVKQ